jgi:hypothetical protein
VDDVLDGKVVAPGNRSFSNRTSDSGFDLGKGLTFLSKPRPSGPVDGTIYTTAAQESYVGGVHDGVSR